MSDTKLKLYQKKLEKMYQEKDKLEECYDQLYDDFECCEWDGIDQGNVELLEDRFSNCSLTDEVQKMRSIAHEIDKLEEEIDKYIVQEYSRAVFDYYANKDLLLTERDTMEHASWREVFGEKYDSLSKKQRYELVGIVEGFGPYQCCQEIS